MREPESMRDRIRVMVVVGLALGVASACCAPASALISRGHVFAGTLEGAAEDTLVDPTGVAVDEATGEVYVVDRQCAARTRGALQPKREGRLSIRVVVRGEVAGRYRGQQLGRRIGPVAGRRVRGGRRRRRRKSGRTRCALQVRPADRQSDVQEDGLPRQEGRSAGIGRRQRRRRGRERDVVGRTGAKKAWSAASATPKPTAGSRS